MAITLPTEKLAPKTQDPKNLIMYGSPKAGKTTLLATLEDNLIVDLEDGSDYVSALKVKVHNLTEFGELVKALSESEHKYKFITIDTITALEEFSKPLALAMYKKTPAGANYKGDITLAPNGSGWGYLRQAMESLIEKLAAQTTNIIIVGHVKDKAVVSNEGQEVGNIKDFDVTGKFKIFCKIF